MLAVAFFGTLILGVKIGIFAAVGVSMLWFVVKTTRPHYALLGRLPGTIVYRNIKRNPDAETQPHIVALRFDAQFYYGNVSFLKEVVREAEVNMDTELRALVLDASAMNQLDSSADTALHELLRDYRQRGIELWVANVKGPVKDVMNRSGFSTQLGEQQFTLTVNEAMENAQHWVKQRR
ncbi:MAG: sodium-independent anion transporter, partial [Natronospirillum sp.]